MGSPFVGARVLEISSGVAAGFAGRMLRGYGAVVRRVALPGVAPLTDDETTYLHAGKPAEAEPRDWDPLFAGADVVLSDLQPAALRSRGIAWDEVRARHPHLVVVSATPFGLTGPYADWQATNAVSFAMGGIMSLTGDITRMAIETTFSSPAAMEQLLTMGMDEGMASAMGQIPDILQATKGRGR